MAKFIFVVDDEFDSSVDSFGGFVKTSASDVVRIFEANGLYSPVVDAATSREVEEEGGGGGEIEADDDDVDDGTNGIR